MPIDKEEIPDTFLCPYCGEEVKVGARACPHCGSDEKTGWSDNADLYGADIPSGYGGDEEFNYEDFLQQEFGGRNKKSKFRHRTFYLIAASALLFLLLLTYLWNLLRH